MIYRYEATRSDGPNGTAPGFDSKTVTYLATVEGVGFIHVPDDAEAPVVEGVEVHPIRIDKDLRDKIRAASPLCRRIKREVVARIRQRYSLEDEIGLLRVGQSDPEYLRWNDHVEACRKWGREQRAAVGL